MHLEGITHGCINPKTILIDKKIDYVAKFGDSLSAR